MKRNGDKDGALIGIRGGPQDCAGCVLCKAERDGTALTQADLDKYVAEGRLTKHEIIPGIFGYAPVPPTVAN